MKIGPIFIALFLFWETRGLFMGWLRAMIAAGLAPMGVWILTVMTLAVLEPWLIALAQQRLDGELDAATAMTTAAIVLVFSFSQIALLAGIVVTAMGLQFMGRGRRWEGTELTRQSDREIRPPAESEPRPQQLAQTLQTLDLVLARQLEYRRSAGAAGLAAGGLPDAAPAARLGDIYRRSGFHQRRRIGVQGAT